MGKQIPLLVGEKGGGEEEENGRGLNAKIRGRNRYTLALSLGLSGVPSTGAGLVLKSLVMYALVALGVRPLLAFGWSQLSFAALYAAALATPLSRCHRRVRSPVAAAGASAGVGDAASSGNDTGDGTLAFCSTRDVLPAVTGLHGMRTVVGEFTGRQQRTRPGEEGRWLKYWRTRVLLRYYQ